MAITGINNCAAYAGYNIGANKNALESAQTAANKPKAEKSGSTPREYQQYLTEKYDCLKSRDYTVTINPAFLNQAAGDEEKAAWLEENLSLIPEMVEKTRARIEAGGGRMLSCSVTINGYDSMTMIVCGQSEADPGTEKAGETLLDKLQKKTAEKAAEKRAEKREDDARQIARLIAQSRNTEEMSRKILAGKAIKSTGVSPGSRLDLTA